MSLFPGDVKDIHNLTIDDLIQLSYVNQYNKLEWIPYSQITDIRSSQIDYAIYKRTLYDGSIYGLRIMLLLLGSSEACTPTFVSAFARIYSLPTHKYTNNGDNFRRYSTWLKERNNLIKGFTKYKDSYYMVAERHFSHCYSRYGFCSECGILRCSPVWCICGHKALPDEWTSNNKQLNEFIKKSQLQTNSANEAYLEWIPFDCVDDRGHGCGYLYGLPNYAAVKLIPLEITDKTHDLYYAEVNRLLMRHVY